MTSVLLGFLKYCEGASSARAPLHCASLLTHGEDTNEPNVETNAGSCHTTTRADNNQEEEEGGQGNKKFGSMAGWCIFGPLFGVLGLGRMSTMEGVGECIQCIYAHMAYQRHCFQSSNFVRENLWWWWLLSLPPAVFCCYIVWVLGLASLLVLLVVVVLFVLFISCKGGMKPLFCVDDVRSMMIKEKGKDNFNEQVVIFGWYGV